MSRYISVQGGRKPQADDDDLPWGTTSSNAHYRAFDAAERSSCRDSPVHAKRPVERSRSSPGSLIQLADGDGFGRLYSAGTRGSFGGQGHSQARGRTPSDLSHIRGRATPTARSISGRSLHSSAGSMLSLSSSAARLVPIPENDRPFHTKSTSQEHEEKAREARLQAMPNRDETLSRAERLPAEMALAGCSRASVRSASTVEDDRSSVYTVESSASGGSFNSKSYGSNKPQLVRRVPTADSDKLREMPGNIARRRMQAQLLAPAQWEADRHVLSAWEKEHGCVGLVTANFVPRRAPELRAYQM